MKLPKLYASVNIKFSSLRNGIGSNYGVIFDCDQMVARKVRRVICNDGWKFQIIDSNKLREWDWFIDIDQECLNEIGMDISLIEEIKREVKHDTK